MIKGLVVASVFLGTRGIDFEIVEPSEKWSRDSRVLRGSTLRIIESSGGGVTSGMAR